MRKRPGQKAQRYVRLGGPIATIYPGTLDDLNQAVLDCLTTSHFIPDELITLSAVYGRRNSVIIRRYKGGRQWEPDSAAST